MMAQTKTLAHKKAGGTKRKREDPELTQDTPVTTNPPSKKSRQPQTSYDTTIPPQSPAALSKTFLSALQKHNSTLSTIELEDLSLPPSCFRDTTGPDSPSTRLLPDLLPFLTSNTSGGLPTLQSCPKENGTPNTIVLSSSAIRCTDVLRVLRDKIGSEENKLAKLFAKHMKLKVMEQYVRDTKFGLGAGTPGRVLDLLKSGALRVDELKRIVLDASYIDSKNRVLMDDRESFDRLAEFLNEEKVKARLVKGEIEILVF